MSRPMRVSLTGLSHSEGPITFLMITPSGLMTQVSGTPVAWYACFIAPVWSCRMSKVSPRSRANAATTESPSSSMLTATTAKPLLPSLRDSRSSDGISTRHGSHHVAQRFRSTRRVRRGDGLRGDAAVHLEERARPVRREQLARAADLVVRGGEIRLAPEPGVHGHHEQQIQVGDHLFGERERGAGVERQSREHAAAPRRSQLALDVHRRLGVEREHRRARRREGLEVALRLEHHQVHVDRLVREPAQCFDHVGTEREIRHEPSVHHVDVQPIGARRQYLTHLLREAREIGRQDAGRDADAVHSFDHHGLRATTTSTTVPGAARVPAAGRCAITVPGVASPERRRVTVPSARPSCSRRVRASACDRPSRPGTAMVGAPRLTTTVTGAPGARSVVAAGRVSIVTPGAAAACTDSTCATVSPAATISCCASGPSSPATCGTGILGGPSLDTRVTRSPAGALTPGGGSCQMMLPCGALGCDCEPPSCTCRPALRRAAGTAAGTGARTNAGWEARNSVTMSWFSSGSSEQVL